MADNKAIAMAILKRSKGKSASEDVEKEDSVFGGEDSHNPQDFLSAEEDDSAQLDHTQGGLALEEYYRPKPLLEDIMNKMKMTRMMKMRSK